MSVKSYLRRFPGSYLDFTSALDGKFSPCLYVTRRLYLRVTQYNSYTRPSLTFNLTEEWITTGRDSRRGDLQ